MPKVETLWQHENPTSVPGHDHRIRQQTLERVHGSTLDAPAQDVALVIQAWATRDTAGQQEVAASTFNQRLAILSSFYAFARKRQLLLIENPVSLVDRRKVYAYAHVVALTPDCPTAMT